MRLWALVLSAVALLPASARGGAVCEQLRVPPASVEHVMVHIASFDEVFHQARHFASAFKLPAFKTTDLTRQLLEAVEDMVRFQTSEAMVNLTLDHTLTYAVSFDDPDNAGAMVDRDIRFTPEQSIADTVEAFCEQNRLDDSFHEQLRPRLEEFLIRDWGCESNKSTGGQPERADPPVKLPALKIWRKQSLPVLEVGVGGTKRMVKVSADQELELQASALCMEWRTSLRDCLNLLDAMHNITRDHPAFAVLVRNRTSAVTDLQLHLRSPAAEITHPRSQRMYLEGDWWNMTTGDAVAGSHNVCVHIDLAPRPQFCREFPPHEHDVWYIRPYTMTAGHHVVVLSKPVASSPKKKDDDEDGDGDNDDDGEEGNDEEGKVPLQFIAARHFWMVDPIVELKEIQLQDVDSKVYLNLQIQTTAVDLSDPDVRVCVLVNAALECFQRDQLLVEANSGAHDQITTLFRAPVFGAGHGKHTVSVLLVNALKKGFASTAPLTVNVALKPGQTPLARQGEFFHEPPLASHRQLPVQCPSALSSVGLTWICDLWRHEWGLSSQNGEDGVLQSIFHNVGVANRVYVEFGTEDGDECNTRYLREAQNWTGLLMDGRYEDATINLHKEWISPENINALFDKYDVPGEFDLLSIDVDFNDYWILDAIDRTRFSPRVIVIEVNSHIPPDEPRVVKYKGPAAAWDGSSLYFGVGVGAMHLWGKRNGYSLVYCESRGVNCFLVRDDVLASVSDDDDDDDGEESLVVSHVLRPHDVYTPPNFFDKKLRYPPPTPESGVVEEWMWLDENGVV